MVEFRPGHAPARPMSVLSACEVNDNVPFGMQKPPSLRVKMAACVLLDLSEELRN